MMKLIDLCGMAGGCGSEAEARFALLEAGFDPELALEPDAAVTEAWLAEDLGEEAGA